MSTRSFDSTRLARLGPWMKGWVHRGRLPGAQILIHHRGAQVFAAQTGRRDIERGRPWTPDTLARIYSMTKPVTTAALLMLYEDGLCHLDTPLGAFLPEFADMTVLRPGATALDQTEPLAVPLTLHHLMTHTSGLTYGFNTGPVAEAMNRERIAFTPGQGALEETVARLADLPLAFQPGTRWNYGVSTDVLGRVIEVISGKSLAAFLAERIFAPLHMADTGFVVPPAKEDRLAACYQATPEDALALLDPGPGTAYRAGHVRQCSGGGGLVSTAEDYMRFARMLLDGGVLDGERLLAPGTAALMRTNALPGDLASMGQPVFSEIAFDGVGFGLGLWVMLDPARARTLASPGDAGWGGMASTVFWIDPAEDLAVVFLTQLVPSSTYPLRKELRALVYSSLI